MRGTENKTIRSRKTVSWSLEERPEKKMRPENPERITAAVVDRKKGKKRGKGVNGSILRKPRKIEGERG